MTRKAQASPAALALKTDAIAKAFVIARNHHVQGQLVLAEAAYRHVLTLDPNNADALHMSGLVAFQSGNIDDGIRLMKRAARRSPREAAIFVNLGAAYRKAGRNAEARDAYETAIKLNPKSWDAHYNRGSLLTDIADFEGAIKSYQTCLALDPSHPDAYVNLGNVYKIIGDGDKALAAYEQALLISPKIAEAYGNIAAVMVDRSEFAEALAFMNKAIEIDPRPGELRFKRSLIALRLEHFSVGWIDYESRYAAETERIPRFPGPPPDWAGEDLTGKTILVWTEQGLGDEILYSNMLNDLIPRAARCIIECSPRMVPIFTRSFPLAKVLRYQGQGARTTPPSDFDTQISVTSLGKYFRQSPESFPRHAGYLKADPARTEALRARYRAITPGNLVVGVAWRSKNDKLGLKKSADLASWADIFRVPGVTFVNLQYGDCDAELAAVKGALGVDIFQDVDVNPMKSMDDCFAQVAAMDLVITTSNTTVHVAGSLNVPAWLLLTTGPASLWYWFLDRVDSPWYPSVRIFRRPAGQVDADDWWRDGVARIGQDLARASEEHQAGGTTPSA